MPSYLEKALLPEEKLLYIATLHWIIFLPGLFLTVTSGIIGFFSYDIAGSLLGETYVSSIGRALAGAAMLFAIFGFFLLCGAVIRQSSTELAITNKRVIAKYGFVSRSTFEIMINRIAGVNFDQSVMGRIFGYGTVLVHGTGGDVSPFDVVANPQRFQHALMDILEHVK
ncbi:MAG: PH domain-containing protein [Bdellovibrionales bacterium]